MKIMNINNIINNGEYANETFLKMIAADNQRIGASSFLYRWLFAEKLTGRGLRAEMSFNAYEGITHLQKFFNWHNKASLPHYFSDQSIATLIDASVDADQAMFNSYSINTAAINIPHIGNYNAQDHLFMRAYPVPDRCKTRVLLDFGAGHGRLANLSFFSPIKDERVETYIAVDAIPSTYFTQLAYFKGLGLNVWEYLEHHSEELTSNDILQAMESHDVIHLPTWRMDLLPSSSVDTVACVQVLKELPGELLINILQEFKRITKEEAAIYIRDHVQFHNPNHMPIDELLLANGFKQEFAPAIKDRVDSHGLPRIWRKINPQNFVSIINK